MILLIFKKQHRTNYIIDNSIDSGLYNTIKQMPSSTASYYSNGISDGIIIRHSKYIEYIHATKIDEVCFRRTNKCVSISGNSKQKFKNKNQLLECFCKDQYSISYDEFINIIDNDTIYIARDEYYTKAFCELNKIMTVIASKV